MIACTQIGAVRQLKQHGRKIIIAEFGIIDVILTSVVLTRMPAETLPQHLCPLFPNRTTSPAVFHDWSYLFCAPFVFSAATGLSEEIPFISSFFVFLIEETLPKISRLAFGQVPSCIITNLDAITLSFSLTLGTTPSTNIPWIPTVTSSAASAPEVLGRATVSL